MGRSVKAMNATSSVAVGINGSRWLASVPIDPAMSPLDAMIAAEDVELRAKRRAKMIQPGQTSDKHVRVFMTGCRAWENVIVVECPTCKNLPKPPGWYCGECDTPKGSAFRRVKPKPEKVAGETTEREHVETRKEKRAKKGRAA